MQCGVLSQSTTMNGSGRGPGPVPPRWLQCPRKALSVIGDKFMAFKTPLSSQFDAQVPVECRFNPGMLVSSLKQYKVKLGLWIDLTNTTRFYPREEVEEELGIKYVKLQCRGHGETPSPEQTRVFINLCSTFIKKNPLQMIGIHCTHGFNRSGFLIAAFLVENGDWSIEAAVDAFARARPPGIYKKDYIDELFRRYGDVEDAPDAPELPDWCYDEASNGLDDDGDPLASGGDDDSAPAGRTAGGGGGRRERNKKNPQFMEGVPGVRAITSQPRLGQIQKRIQEMCGWNDTGFPGCQPVSMDRDNMQFLADTPYKVSWKADGTRYMMLIDGEDQIYFADRDNAIFRARGLTFPYRKNLSEHLADTLVDGEMVIDRINGQDHPRFLVYDIIRFRGEEVGKTRFDTRLTCIRKEIIEARHTAIEAGRLDKSSEPFSIRAKDFWDPMQTNSLLSEKFCRSLGHEPDGLIFQPLNDPYVAGRCDMVLKWKPASHNSVDFRLKIVNEGGEGMLTRKRGLLYVGSLQSPFAQIKLTKELKALNNKIIECTFENNQWVFMRERTDKSYPNGYETAKSVCNTIQHPVTKEMLLSFIRERAKRRPDNDLMPPPAAKRQR
ncbi:mRNA-capping enzyme-like isoform X1 [Amphibalanus amphitrite]|uniref:mRNA-capping enzyme-like isoform X1 n=2 Tax=Amphibalanus amphitrite TaxID=1232801 RepID=UPI001C90DABD|nr:mRNA-capping enzyme-like isoform X1 [Amphibalanus amphitrite]